MQIWRDAVSETETAIAMSKGGFYGEGDWELQNKKAMLKHLRDINSTLYHGDRGLINVTDVVDSKSKALRQTGGCDFFIPSGNILSQSTLTSIDLDDFAMDAFQYADSSDYIFLVGANILSALRAALDTKLEYRVGDSVHGVKVNRIMTSFGELDLAYDKFGLDQGSGLGGRGYLLKKDELKWHSMPGRNTHIVKGRQSNGVDARTDEIVTEGGVSFGQVTNHSMIKGIARPTNA